MDAHRTPDKPGLTMPRPLGPQPVVDSREPVPFRQPGAPWGGSRSPGCHPLAVPHQIPAAPASAVLFAGFQNRRMTGIGLARPAPTGRAKVMEEVTEESAELVERVAALDIGKASLVCCVRVPHESRPGGRRQEVRTCGTVTPVLLELRDWLVCQGVTRVVWRPPPRTGSLRSTCSRTTSSVGWSTPATSRTCPAGPRQARRGLAVQARRARRAAAQLHPRPGRAAAAGPDPLPAHLDPGTQPGEAARRNCSKMPR